VVTRQTVRAGLEKLRLHTPDDSFRAIGTAREIVYPGYPEFWLVAQKSIEAASTIVQLLKMLVQTRDGLRVSAHFTEKTGQILRHHPGIGRAGRFDEAVVTLRGEMADECAVWIARDNRSCPRVKQILPV